MTRWGEIKCPNCTALEERLEAARRDAKEAEAYAEELEAKLFTCATDLDTYMNAHAALEAKMAQQDDLVQAAVAAALREAADAIQSVANNCTTEDGHVAIIAAVEKVRSLMPEDAQAALDRVAAKAVKPYRIALADAIRRPMGVVPASAEELVTTAELDAAEQRRSAIREGGE